MSDLFDYKPTGEQLAAEGMERATKSAEKARPGWTDDAFDFLKYFASANAEFIGEDVKAWAYRNGLDEPPNDSCWGTVMRRGSKERITEFLGYAKRSQTAARHGTPSRLWKSLVYKGAPSNG